MKITFEISQSIQDLLEYCQSDKYSDFEMVHDENGVPYRNKAKMVVLIPLLVDDPLWEINQRWGAHTNNGLNPSFSG